MKTKVSNRTNMDQNKNYVPLPSTIYNNLILSNKKITKSMTDII